MQRGSSDWFSRLQQYIRTAFPHAAVTAKNGCVPGGHSEFVAACLDKFVSQDADLILVEVRVACGMIGCKRKQLPVSRKQTALAVQSGTSKPLRHQHGQLNVSEAWHVLEPQIMLLAL